MSVAFNLLEQSSKMSEIKVFAEASKRGHEEVAFFNFPSVGLRAIVAIHNTALGPALGGCRMRMYDSEDQAIDDAMRLAEGMTYKSSMAGLDLGGGKSVVIADPAMKEGREALFQQFAHCLNRLNGCYITAEDMGTSVSDIMVMRAITKFAAGFAPEQGGGGDPSPWTARGVFYAIQAACERRYGSKDLSSKHVTVQGVGHVGLYLVEMLKQAGAKVTCSDTNRVALQRAKQDLGAEIVELDKIYDVACDIYSPCAIGQTVNPITLKRLHCDIIAGAANNQLSDASTHPLILEKKIMYCPDFVINSGGVISVGAEYVPGGWKEQWVKDKVNQISATMQRVLDESEKRKKFTEVVAIELAKERVAEAEKRRGKTKA